MYFQGYFFYEKKKLEKREWENRGSEIDRQRERFPTLNEEEKGSTEIPSK